VNVMAIEGENKQCEPWGHYFSALRQDCVFSPSCRRGDKQLKNQYNPVNPVKKNILN